MALTQHNLADINNLACGIVKCKLFYDDSITATVPTGVPFINIGDFIECIDADPAVVDNENVQLTIKEDYSVHAEGFWWKIINGYPSLDIQIMFSIMEGSDEIFLYRGSIFRENTVFDEPYLNGADVVRTLSMQLVSIFTALSNIPTTTLTISTVPVTDIIDSTRTYHGATLGNLLLAMIALAYNASISDCILYNNSTDIEGASNGDPTNWLQWDDLFFMAQTDDLLAPSDHHGFLSPSQEAWSNTYAKCSDLFKHVCTIFGCVASYSYCDNSGVINFENPSLNKHRITLSSRGKNTFIIPTGSLISSQPIASSPIQAKNIHVALITDSTKACAWVNGAQYLVASAIPTNTTFDIDLVADFRTDASYVGSLYNYYNILYSAWNWVSDPSLYISHIRYWNYTTSGYDAFDLYISIANYNHYRFMPNRFQYTRIYGSLKGTVGGIASITNLKSLIGHKITAIINEVSEEKNFYATQTKKNLKTNQTEIIWIQE